MLSIMDSQQRLFGADFYYEWQAGILLDGFLTQIKYEKESLFSNGRELKLNIIFFQSQ